MAADDRSGRRRLAPLWRAAPRRLLRDPVTLALMSVVLALVAAAGSAGPLYAEAVSDASVRLVLDAVPAGSAARDAPVVRVNGGVEPATTRATRLTEALDDVPGLGPVRVTLQSVSTELNPRIYFDPVGPVLGHGGTRTPVRLFGVEDPAARLVVVDRSTEVRDGLWLPQPVAEEARVSAGDRLTLSLTGTPEPVETVVGVAGVYAVADDGRTPLAPPGERLWDDLQAEGFPADPVTRTLRAHLAVADLRTTAALADRIEDDVLWSALAVLEPARPRLAGLEETSAGVTDLRRSLVEEAEGRPLPPALRAGVASGVVDLGQRARELSDAARRGATVTTGVGVALSLAVVVAAAGWSSGRRRREVRLMAGTGRHPAAAGLLHVVELLPAAVIGGTVGWVAARALVDAAAGAAAPSPRALVTSGLWCLGSVLAALLLSGGVLTVVMRTQTRRLEGREGRSVPWVLVLVVLAAATTAGLLTRPPEAGDPLGPLDVLVPPLAAAAVAALGARAFFAGLGRLGRHPRPPTRRTVAGWLAGRRLRAPDPTREVATTIAATGLAMLVLSLASLVSTAHTTQDRAAARVGAAVVHEVGSSWRLDPEVARQAEEPDDGTSVRLEDVPVARTPVLPPGQTVTWRTRTTVATSEESVELLVIDPATFAEAAAWGTDGGPVAAGRALLPALAAQDAESALATRRTGMGQQVPVVLVGAVGDLGLEPGSTLAVDTLHLPVRLRVTDALAAFPGARPGTLVVPADAFFATQLNEDPRLRPGVGASRNRPMEFRAQLWSGSEDAARATLSAHGLPADPVDTLAGARATAVYVAAEQARRYHVALGWVFGALGTAAVVLAAVRLARLEPGADLMLAWVGAGRRSVARARVLETAVVLVLGAALAVTTLLLLRPAGGVLLEPGDGAVPAAVLELPGSALLAGVGWLAVTAVSAAVAMRLAASSRSPVEVLRGED